MMFILRWPLILILLVFVAASLFPAAISTLVQTDLVDMRRVSTELQALATNATPVETGLWYGSAVFFLLSAIRMARRTQGFWFWLLGFALYGAHWALSQNAEGGALAAVRGLTPNDFSPGNLTVDSLAAQVLVLAGLLVIGLLIFIVDHSDRKHWDRQAA